MTTTDSGLGAIFQAEPERDISTRLSRTRTLTPSEADKAYRGIGFDPEERAILAKERSGSNVRRKNLWDSPLTALTTGIRAYNENVSMPFAELITSYIRAFAPGSDAKERANRKVLRDAWKEGDGFFSKLSNYWKTLSKERQERGGIFPGEKLIGEMLTDPLNFIGWGLLGKVPLAGKVLGAAEKAYMNASQAAVDGVISGSLSAARVFPGTRSLFKLNARTIASKRNAQLFSNASTINPALWKDNPLGGFHELQRLLLLPKNELTADQITALPEMAAVASMLEDVENWTLGIHRMSFNPDGTEAGFIRVDGLKKEAALWEQFKAGLDSETLKGALGQIAELQSQMIHSGKAAQVIAERKMHRSLVAKMFRMNDDMVTWAQRGLPAKLNRTFAELVLGFQAYMPGNAVEDVWRSINGGVTGVRMMDEDLFDLFWGSTRVLLPWSVREGTATPVAQFIGEQGAIDKLASGNRILGKAWTFMGGWGLKWSKMVGAGLRRNYIMERGTQKTLDEVLPVLGRMGEKGAFIRDAIMTGGTGIDGLTKDHVKFMQKLLTSYTGTNGDTIRKLSTMVARKHLSKSYIDKQVVKHLGEIPPKIRRELVNALSTGAHSTERVAAAVQRATEQALDYMVATEPAHVAKTMEWLLTSIDRLRISSPDDMGNLIGMAALFTRQMEDVPLMVTRAMIEHSDLKNPAALRALWPKVNTALDEIFTSLDAMGAHTAIGDKIRKELITMGNPEEAAKAGDAFQRVYDGVIRARAEVKALGERTFDVGKGLSAKAIAEAGDENRAWRAFTTEKSAIYDTLMKNSRGNFVELAQSASRLSAKGFGANAEEFIASQSQQWSDILQGFTKTLEFNDVFGKQRTKLEAFKAAIVQEGETGILNPTQQQKVENWFGVVGDAVDKLDPEERLALSSARDRGLQGAIDDYNRNFTNYDDTMALDDIMTSVMPFWRYESRAWSTMARWAVEKPFYGRTFGPDGYFWQATDDGYIPLDILGMQGSPIRGLILGRLRRAFRDDYPPEHEGMLGTAESWKLKMERFGFYAGTWQTWLAESAIKTITGRGITADLGEDLPAALSTALAGMIYGSVQADKVAAGVFGDDWKDVKGWNASSFVKMANTFFPSRYRDYYVNVYLASHFGVRRVDIENDPEKQWMLLEAEAGVAWRQVISEQSSLTRFRPAEFEKMRDELDTEASRISGLSVKEIHELRKEGKRVQDVVELSRVDLDDLRSMEQFKLVGSVYQPLDISEKGRLQRLMSEYYDDADRVREQAQQEQLDDDLRLESGVILGEEWRDAYKTRWTKVSGFIQSLKDSPRYAGVPLDQATRQAFRERFNISSPIRSPVDDVIDSFYNIEPVPDDRTGQVDWSKFFIQRQDALELLPDDVRETVEQYLLRKETPTVKEFKESNKFMRVYWDLKKYMPLWYRAMGYPSRGDSYLKWALEFEKAQRDARLAIQGGMESTIANRILNKPQFRLVRAWEKEYRGILKNPNTIQRVPWADSRIPDMLRKYYGASIP